MIDKDNNDAFKLLRECAERQYRRCNFSLLITTGSLNILKGRLSQEQGKRSLDRFDVFMYVLNDYFQIKKVKEDYMHIIFSEAWHSAK